MNRKFLLALAASLAAAVNAYSQIVVDSDKADECGEQWSEGGSGKSEKRQF